MTKPTKYLLGLLAAAALSIGTAQAGSVLKIVPHADLKNTDPIWTTAYITRNNGYMIYDTLFAMDETFNVHLQMAGAHSVSDDGLVHTITLRDGLKWHDGSPVTSADCIASINRWGKRDGMGQQLLAVVDTMFTVDNKTFEITLTEPWGLLTTALGKMSSNVPFMMPAEKAYTDPFLQVPMPLIGSGPYKFVEAEWVPGAKVVYEKFSDYVPRSEPASAASGGKIAYFDRVEWLYIPDQNSAMNALINGEVDYFEAPQSDLYDLLDAADDVTTGQRDNYGSQGWLRINHLNAPFDNVKARHAVQLLVDQETYLQAIVGTPDLYRTCGAMFLCDTPFETFVGSERVMTQDIEQAKALLKEAGYNGEKIVLMHPTDIPALSHATQVTASLLRKAGINLEVQAMDWSTLTSRRAEKKSIADGGWNIFHTSWIAPDLLNPVANIGVSGGGVEKAWFGWPTDAKVEQLRQDFARETDPAKQKALADQVQARAMEVVTYVPIGQYLSKYAYRSDRLEGILKGPVPLFWNLRPK